MEQVEHILKNIKREGMRAEEKSRMRGSLAAFMESRPVTSVPSPYAGGLRGIRSAFTVRSIQSRYVQALLMVLLVSGGTMSAAEKTLPGDALYPVKVNFNEKMASALIISPQARAFQEAKLADRRLKEAADLSAQGKLTEEARVVIEKNLELHVGNIEKQVEVLTSNNDYREAIEVNAELQTTLKAHGELLGALATDSSEAGKVASTVRQELSAVSQTLSGLEKKISNEVSAEAEEQARKKAAQAQAKAAEADAIVNSAAADVSPQAVARAHRDMRRSYTYLSEGYLKIEAGQYNRAFFLFQDSIRYSTEAKLSIENARDLKIDVADTEPDATSTPPAVATTTGESAPDEGATSTAAATGTSSVEIRGMEADAAATGTATFMDEASNGFPNGSTLRTESEQSRSNLRALLKLRF